MEHFFYGLDKDKDERDCRSLPGFHYKECSRHLILLASVTPASGNACWCVAGLNAIRIPNELTSATIAGRSDEKAGCVGKKNDLILDPWWWRS